MKEPSGSSGVYSEIKGCLSPMWRKRLRNFSRVGQWSLAQAPGLRLAGHVRGNRNTLWNRTLPATQSSTVVFSVRTNAGHYWCLSQEVFGGIRASSTPRRPAAVAVGQSLPV